MSTLNPAPEYEHVIVGGVYVRREQLCAECKQAMRDGVVTFACGDRIPMCAECINALPASCRVSLHERGDRLGDDDYRAQGECESCERETREEAEAKRLEDLGTWGRS